MSPDFFGKTAFHLGTTSRAKFPEEPHRRHLANHRRWIPGLALQRKQPYHSTQMKGRFPKKIGGQKKTTFFFLFRVEFWPVGLFISFLFSFNLLERLKRSAFQRRPRMIPCLLAAAAMVMRYGRLCAENRSGHVHYVPTTLSRSPRPADACRCLRRPQ